MSTKYTKQIRFEFECAGESFEIELDERKSDEYERLIHVEESRKNGQEDEHYAQTFEKVGGKWRATQMRGSWSGVFAALNDNSIVKFLNKNEPPKE